MLGNYKLKVHKNKSQLSVVVLILVVGYLLRWLWQPWFPLTIDGEDHHARFGNYYVALMEGQFPPRWAPTMNFGFGYPIFHYSYPLPNMMGVVWIFGGMSVMDSVKMVMSLSLALGGLGMFTWINKKFGWLSGLVAGFLYVSAPYTLLDIYVRANIGETVAMGLLPWVLMVVDIYLEKQTSKNMLMLIGVMAVFGLTHTITVLLAAQMVLVYVWFVYGWRKLRLLLVPGLLSFLLAAFFWIPAVADTNYIVLSESNLNNAYAKRFLEWDKLTSFPWQIDQTFDGVESAIPIQLGYAQMVSFLVAWYVMVKSKKLEGVGVFFGLVFLIGLFLMLPVSKPVWHVVPIARYVQFPSRLVFYTTFAGSALAGWLVKEKGKGYACVLVAMAMVNAYYFNPPIAREFFDDNYLFEFPLTSTAADEYDPVWYDSIGVSKYATKDRSNPVVVDELKVIVEPVFKNGIKKRYKLDVAEKSMVVEKTMYFPGWETRVDGKKIDIESRKEEAFGLINYELEPGEYLVESRYLQNEPSVLVGNGLSVLGLVVYGGMFGWELMGEKRRRLLIKRVQ